VRKPRQIRAIDAGAQKVKAALQDRFSQPTAREAALLVLHLVFTKQRETNRQVTRARLSELAVRRLWVRSRIPEEFFQDVQEILIHAGWALFWAGSSYAIIKTDAVEGWTLISSKRVTDDLEKVSRGSYDYNQLENLLLPQEEASEDEDSFDKFVDDE
jgi:hypothetical protein